jgi:hypothetical protein
MKRTNTWIAGLALPVMIAMLALVPGPSSVRANDQPSAATASLKAQRRDSLATSQVTPIRSLPVLKTTHSGT